MTVSKALHSELRPIFIANPEVFSKECNPNYWHSTSFAHPIDNIIATYLLHEKQKADKSFWYPYVRLLPKSFDWLIGWSKDEYLELQDLTLLQDLKAEIKEVSLACTQLQECLRNYEALFSAISMEEIKWAYGVVYSRAFCKQTGNCVVGNDEESALVPLADSFNHENVDTSYGYEEAEETVELEDDSEQSSGCGTDNDSDYA
eukprot:TRINITY_DN577_c0_g1_i24.p1 TRINITY_DN577_c0_g1~~TRINITY_DN577_c0_g1_i24.p1  ORF type:complete len:203 (-),score=49.03 TRINITY_DN577_c0_g1_i24:1021-1629(-)